MLQEDNPETSRAVAELREQLRALETQLAEKNSALLLAQEQERLSRSNRDAERQQFERAIAVRDAEKERILGAAQETIARLQTALTRKDEDIRGYQVRSGTNAWRGAWSDCARAAWRSAGWVGGAGDDGGCAVQVPRTQAAGRR
jgi:hypothetical protein